MQQRLYSLILCFAILCGAPAHAQDEYFAPPKRVMKALRTETPPKIDGVFDEAEWANAEVMTDFVNVGLNAYSEDQANVRMLYDETYMYFAVEVMQPKADIVANVFKYDRIELRFEDYFQIGLDTLHDGGQAYLFLFSPIGTRWDGREGIFGRNASWDGDWKVQTIIAEDRWYGEVRIPIGMMHLNRTDDQTWGINFRRRYTKKNHSHHWNYDPNAGFTGQAQGPKFVADFGILDDLDLAEVHIQRDPKVETYVSATSAHIEGGDSDLFLSSGLDAELRLSSHWTAQFTVNPDFGEVAADEGDVANRDTARFLFERRTFFNEGAELFQTPITVYDSRKITDIDTAAKITGTGDGWTLASLVLRGAGSRSGEDADFLVTRYYQDATENVQLGATLIAVDRQVGDNTVFGIDSRVKFSPTVVWTNQLLQMTGQDEVNSITNETDSVSAHAFESGLEWGTQPWSFGLNFRKITEDFLPDLAFISRRDIMGPTFEVGYDRDFTHPFFESFFARAEVEHYVNHDHETVLRDYSLFGRVATHSDWDLNFWFQNDFHIPYHNNSNSIGTTYKRQDRFKSWRVNYTRGDFQNIPFDEYEVEKPFKFTERWTNEFSTVMRQENRVNEDRDVWLWRHESEYTFKWDGRLKLTLEATSDRAYKRTLLFAYEDVKDWDFFVVVNDFRDDETLGEEVVRSLFLKFIYHW